MNSYIFIIVFILYFGLILLIARWTNKKSMATDFYNADKQSPWYLVFYGMIGTTLSGVTFISVPAMVATKNMSYFQMVLGYVIGYYIVAHLLLPLYYRNNLITIYSFLKDRMGYFSHKTSSFFFIISRLIGASFRFYIVVLVLENFVFGMWNIPFWLVSAIALILVIAYSYQGGIKTIVYTDTMQTTFMLLSLGVLLYFMGLNVYSSFSSFVSGVIADPSSQIFHFDGSGTNFFKQFFSGIFMVIVMTGLDQDMMQKNLTCRSISDAQKNIKTLSWTLVFVNLTFLVFGIILYQFAALKNIPIPEKTDLLFPTVALQHSPLLMSIIFLLGIIAAAFSSVDGTLASLTTTFCLDILEFEPTDETRRTNRTFIHFGFTFLAFLVIIFFHGLSDDNVINTIFNVAGYTYGPILGLFAYAIFTPKPIHDRLVPIVCLITPILSYIISINSANWFGYTFGFELLLLNGFMTWVGLMLLIKR